MNMCPYLDRAIYYRVEDIPSASCVGSRLANILEQLQKTGRLSKTILKLLDNQGLLALSRLTSKDVSCTAFLHLAEQEQKVRTPSKVFNQKSVFSTLCDCRKQGSVRT